MLIGLGTSIRLFLVCIGNHHTLKFCHVWRHLLASMLTKVYLVKAMVFPVVKYRCESWTVKSTEELMLLNCGVEDPWTARRFNQSILKEISSEYSLKGLMVKLKIQYFGHLMRRTDSLEKTLMLGKIEGRRRRE